MKRSAFEELVTALDGRGCTPKKTGAGQVRASCPGPMHSHGNKKSPALQVTQAPGSVLVHCFVGCEPKDILKPLGWRLADLYDERRADYTYIDNDLKVNRVSHRTYVEGGIRKTFYQDQHKTNDVPNPVIFYHLRELVAGVEAGKPVYLVEGEADVRLLESLGHVATTAPQGAGNFDKVDPAPLKGATVTAIVDRDKAGDDWAKQVRDLVGPIAGELVFKQSNLERKGSDFSDHYAAGGTLDTLVPYIFPESNDDDEPVWEILEVSAEDVRAVRPEFLWQDRIVLEQLNLVSGRGGEGKSSLMLDTAAKITRGLLPGKFEGIPRTVAISAHEDDLGVQKLRLQVAGADMKRVKFWSLGKKTVREDGTIEVTERSLRFPRDLPAARQALARLKPAMWIIDPISSVIEGDPYKADDVRASLEPLISALVGTGVALVGIKHFTKGSGRAGSLLGDSHAWRDVARSHIPMVADPETGERVYTLEKGNYSKEQGQSWKFRLEDTQVTDDDGNPWNVAKVVDLGRSDVTVDQVINRPHESEDDQEERNSAQQFVLDVLRANGGEAPSRDVIKAGRGAGFSEQDLKNARRRSRSPRIKTRKGSGFGSGWVWAIEVEDDLTSPEVDLPKVSRKDPQGVKGVSVSEGGTLGTFEEPVTPSPTIQKWDPSMKLTSSFPTQGQLGETA